MPLLGNPVMQGAKINNNRAKPSLKVKEAFRGAFADRPILILESGFA